MLKISNLNKNFGSLKVLKNINLSLEKGEILSVLGESGCGKSTLLRIIADLESKDSGEIKLQDGVTVAMMFQNYALFPHLNVRENIAFALHKLSKTERAKVLDELLDKFQITQIADKMIDQISGGQAQRVAFARAVANKEKLLLLDEPFANLDHHLRHTLRAELKQMIKNSAISAIMVTHDKEDAFMLSDKIALIKAGEVLDVGEPKQLYFEPKSYQIASFLGQINSVKECENLPNEFKEWLKSKNYMFRPEQIRPGDKYEAAVLNSRFLGAFYELDLSFMGAKFKALINSNTAFGDTFKFDVV
ncbi:MAG: ABC transporter ATP-binding protein [Campylobacter sp.]|nr:ABC transporter ATP-binding protein [Campylobacter sp.]